MAENAVSGAGDVPVLRLVTILLRFRFTIVGAAAAGAFVVGLATLLSQRHYTAETAFTPQTRTRPSAVSGLASQFGLDVPGTDPSRSPAFYADLLKSRQVLEGVVDSRFSVLDNAKELQGSLVDLFKIRGSRPALKREAAITQLVAAIEVLTSTKTGVVRLRVTMKNPQLARSVADTFLSLLNAFNLRTRQSQASEERRFTEQRVAEVRADLKSAEDREQEFLQRNRDFRNSPELTFAHDRLAREVAMQQQLYTTEVQAYEQAKVEEVRDTPVITVIESPEVPARPDPRGTIRKTALGFLLGGILAALFAFWRDFLQGADRAARPEVEEYLQLRGELVADLRHPVRAVRRAFESTLRRVAS